MPAHPESHPSFYLNARKNLFYCDGCGRDLIRFVQLYLNLPFRETVTHLKHELALPPVSDNELLNDALSFYQHQLYWREEALDYLHQRGLHNSELTRQLGRLDGRTGNFPSLGLSPNKTQQIVRLHHHCQFYP